MRSPGRPASGAGRGWSADRASFLDRLDLEVRALAARGVSQRLLGGQTRFATVVPHHVTRFERMGGGWNRRGVGTLQGIDRGQDVAQLVTGANDLVWCDPQPRETRDVLNFTGRKLGLGCGQDL